MVQGTNFVRRNIHWAMDRLQIPLRFTAALKLHDIIQILSSKWVQGFKLQNPDYFFVCFLSYWVFVLLSCHLYGLFLSFTGYSYSNYTYISSWWKNVCNVWITQFNLFNFTVYFLIKNIPSNSIKPYIIIKRKENLMVLL